MLLKGFAPPPRPYMNKDILFKTVAEWKEGTEEFHDIDTVDEDIYDIIKSHKKDQPEGVNLYSYDAYDIAKKLDDEGYDITITEVHDIDELLSKCTHALNEAVCEWVKENDIKPKIEIGKNVGFDYNRKTKNGVVSGFVESIAKYKVRFNDDGSEKFTLIEYEVLEEKNGIKTI